MDDAALALGGVTGARPTVAWVMAPWFGDSRFLDSLSADALAEAVMRTMDHGHDLDSEGMRERLSPWLKTIESVRAREPKPEAMAKMAIFLRACGLTDSPNKGWSTNRASSHYARPRRPTVPDSPDRAATCANSSSSCHSSRKTRTAAG